MKIIPKLEEASAEYARLSDQHNELMARASAISEEIRVLHAAVGTEHATTRHADRVAALVSGIDYSAPPPISDQIAALSAEGRVVDEAIRTLSGHIALERQAASRTIVGGFESERLALASEFFEHIAAAAKVHASYGAQRLKFHRAGVDPAGFTGFGIEMFGDPGHRNGQVGVAMRTAVRHGYLKEAQIPEAYR
jgi:hypothetical protein